MLTGMPRKEEIRQLRNRLRQLERPEENEACDKEESPGYQEGPQMGAMAMRETAKGALLSRIKNLQRKIDRLQVLHDSLPGVLSPEADEALWELIQSLR